MLPGNEAGASIIIERYKEAPVGGARSISAAQRNH